MATTEERTYYTVPEAARVLGVSRATVWRWIKAERLPAQRVGPRILRVRRADVEALVQPADPATETPEERARRKREELFKDYDPDATKAALLAIAGTWEDVDADALIADIYRWREEGTRPPDRPPWPI
jgi:excisionase family DNA binding protein